MLKEMLTLLEKNAQLNVKDLAALLNEQEDTIAQAIQTCQDNKIIAGYHAVINWDKADKEIVKAVIMVNAKAQRNYGYDYIAGQISKYSEVDSLYLISGQNEFLLIINGQTMKEVANFVAHKLAPIEGIDSTETMFILKEYKVMGSVFEQSEQDERLNFSL